MSGHAHSPFNHRFSAGAAALLALVFRIVTMPITESDLHAYVDGELSGREHAEITTAILASEKLRKRVSELRALTELVRLAYATRTIPCNID